MSNTLKNKVEHTDSTGMLHKKIRRGGEVREGEVLKMSLSLLYFDLNRINFIHLKEYMR
jgi:hypothetical protein